jgi:hypothetical protein
MFLPVHYRLKGSIQESLYASAGISVLLHLIIIRFEYLDKKSNLRLRILGIPIRLGEEKKKSSPQKRSKKVKIKKLKREQLKEPDKNQQSVHPAKDIIITSSKVDNEEPSDVKFDQTKAKENKPVLEKKPSRGIVHKVEHFWQKLMKLPQNVVQKLLSLNRSFENIKDKVFDETNKAVIAKIWVVGGKLLHHILPRKIMAKITYGTDDPALTGQLLGFVSIIPFIYRYQIQIQPDFQSETYYLKGNLEIKGKIRMIHFVIAAIRLLRDKNIRTLIKKYRS